MAHHGFEPCCLICGATWLLERDDLHHRTYARLGHESCRDLIPLCRSCHGEIHRVLESDRSWRRLDRAQATDLIVKALRRRTIRGWSASHKTFGRAQQSCR
jgi:5-methylcytosine-specific restriction endonuclease McrA